MSHVFLFIVDSGLPAEHTSFAATTFAFLQVCRRWNEVAIAFPQLWVWWIPGTFKAWHLFKSRSKDAPLFLTWQEYLPESAHTVLMESETPKRIRQLDFSGTTHQFKCILNALDSRSLSTTSSIRLRILRSSDGEHLARFSSFPFPKLSRLDVANFLPDLTSSIFVTSNLTSLKLDIPCPDGRYCTQSQLLQVLQQNRNLRQLNFKAGGLSLAGDSGRLVPALLPHLADLKLSGTTEVIDRFLDLVCMSSPIHRITIHFQRNYAHDTEPLVIIMRKLLTMYYGCKELEPQRKVSHFTAFSDTGSIIAGDHLTHPTYCLRLEFQNNKGELFQKVIPLFPLNYILDFTASGFDLATDAWRGILLRMESLSHLRLERMNTESVLNALGPNDGGAHGERIQTIVIDHSRFHGQPRSTGFPRTEITVIRCPRILRRDDRKTVRSGRGDGQP